VNLGCTEPEYDIWNPRLKTVPLVAPENHDFGVIVKVLPEEGDTSALQNTMLVRGMSEVIWMVYVVSAEGATTFRFPPIFPDHAELTSIMVAQDWDVWVVVSPVFPDVGLAVVTVVVVEEVVVVVDVVVDVVVVAPV